MFPGTPPFTTRPEIIGDFGVCTSTHWIASAVGMGVLERGGNAFDAAVAMGFVLQVVEPHLNGPAGDMPAIFRAAGGPVRVLCAQGTAPAGATVEAYRARELDLVPGSGLLATVIPGAFDGWMVLLRDHGTITVAEALAPAIHCARHGHPLLGAAAKVIEGMAPFFAAHWPGSAALWTPGGRVPAPGARLCNPALADTWERVAAEAEAAPGGRAAQIEAARACFRTGFIAQAIHDFVATTEAMDATGAPQRGVLTGDDLAGWEATYENPVTAEFHGWTVHKPGPWTQGPAFLQALTLLRGTDLAAMDPLGPDFVHTVIEAIKLAFADREAHYGDPAFAEVPLETLLSEPYAAERRALIGPRASLDTRPGRPPGHEAAAEAAIARALAGANAGAPGAGEPTMAHLTEKRGDTVHLDVIDRWGNMISATPSGGWLQSSPVIPSLGFALNSRAQMFWLDERRPSTLRPGARPRTTLTPSLALGHGGAMVFGTPGGDQQDQWQLVFFLRHVLHGLNLQQAIDAPLFHSLHMTSSFHPRTCRPGALLIEATAGAEAIDGLRARGHEVDVAPPWSVGRLTAAAQGADGWLRAAATPRLMQAYAVGR